MPASALALVLASAFVHAGWNRLVHGTSDRLATMTVGALVAGVLLGPAMLVWPPWRAGVLIPASGLAQVAYSLFLAAAYARGSLAVAYPIGRGSAPLLVTLASVLVLAEPATVGALLGALALGGGLLLVAGVARGDGEFGAVGWALATGGAIATYSVIDAAAVRHVSAPAYLGAILLSQGVLLAIVLRGDLARLRGALRPGIAVALGVSIAYLLVLLAFQRAPAGRVATLREVSVLLAVLLSPGRRRPLLWVGAALVVVGAVLAARP